MPAMAMTGCQIVDRASLDRSPLAVAGQPGELGACGAHGRQALQRFRRRGELERLVEGCSGAGIATPRPHAADSHERHDLC